MTCSSCEQRRRMIAEAIKNGTKTVKSLPKTFKAMVNIRVKR